jgi:hypothetical protein
MEVSVSKQIAKKVWLKPEVKAISAGSAERAGTGRADGQGQQQS